MYRLACYKKSKCFCIEDFENFVVDKEYVEEKIAIEESFKLGEDLIEQNGSKYGEKLKELNESHKINEEDNKLSVYGITNKFYTFINALKGRINKMININNNK